MTRLVLGGRGSSPRVRGTGQAAGMLVRKRRFIPACAGNSSGETKAGFHLAVHPRVCGEQYVKPKSTR